MVIIADTNEQGIETISEDFITEMVNGEARVYSNKKAESIDRHKGIIRFKDGSTWKNGQVFNADEDTYIQTVPPSGEMRISGKFPENFVTL